MPRAILFVMLLATSAWPARSQDVPAFKSDSETCACVDNTCNNACIRKANPEVIAALRKRFRDLQDDDIGVFYDGAGGWDVAFWTTNAHRACRVKTKPVVKLFNCRQVHG